MNIIEFIRKIFQKKNAIADNSYTYDYVPYAKNFEGIEKEAALLSKEFGSGFYSNLYNKKFEQHLLKELLPFINRKPKDKYYSFWGEWKAKHPFNFPGPFYVGESDTCGTGNPEAPLNVLFDGDGCEFVFKQPENYFELLCVADAADVEVFGSYSANGNEYWTLRQVKDWWQKKDWLIEELNRERVVESNGKPNVEQYVSYLNGKAEEDLKMYSFFLEYSRMPVSTDSLPELKD